jgi:Domain of unknown function (DUF4129)
MRPAHETRAHHGSQSLPPQDSRSHRGSGWVLGVTAPSTSVNALGRPPFVAALGVITLLGVVWAAAAPRPARVIPGLHPDAVLEQQAPPEGLTVYFPEVKVHRIPGPWNQVSDGVAGVLGWTTIGLLVLGAAFCLFLIIRAWLAGREDRSVAPDDAADLDLEALAEAVSADSIDRLGALSGGTPAEGIVAAWTHLEATLYAAGVPLPASRTSTEVSLDVLRRYPVDPATLQVLANLYREARWSRHPLTEEDRARAFTAYRALDAAMRSEAPQAARKPRG